MTKHRCLFLVLLLGFLPAPAGAEANARVCPEKYLPMVTAKAKDVANEMRQRSASYHPLATPECGAYAQPKQMLQIGIHYSIDPSLGELKELYDVHFGEVINGDTGYGVGQKLLVFSDGYAALLGDQDTSLGEETVKKLPTFFCRYSFDSSPYRYILARKDNQFCVRISGQPPFVEGEYEKCGAAGFTEKIPMRFKAPINTCQRAWEEAKKHFVAQMEKEKIPVPESQLAFDNKAYDRSVLVTANPDQLFYGFSFQPHLPDNHEFYLVRIDANGAWRIKRMPLTRYRPLFEGEKMYGF